MTKTSLFLLSFLVSAVGVSAKFYYDRPSGRIVPIAHGVYLTSQLEPRDVRLLRRNFICTIVDLRPDGEAANQPTSAQMETAAQNSGMNFHYIPVPHESIPDSAVDALQEVLSHVKNGNTVLYCRTGRRAVRTYALAEASRPNGGTADEIAEIVAGAGFSADDLKDQITERISRRNPHLPEKK